MYFATALMVQVNVFLFKMDWFVTMKSDLNEIRCSRHSNWHWFLVNWCKTSKFYEMVIFLRILAIIKLISYSKSDIRNIPNNNILFRTLFIQRYIFLLIHLANNKSYLTINPLKFSRNCNCWISKALIWKIL